MIGLCPDGDVQSAISSITKEISEKERNFALVATAADFFKKYHVQLRKRHACPLCERAVGPSDEEQLAAKAIEFIFVHDGSCDGFLLFFSFLRRLIRRLICSRKVSRSW